jgi:hypothetical protein
MKRLLTSFLTFSSIGLLMLASCKKSDKIVTDAGSTSSALTSSATTLVLDKSKVNDTSTAIMFTFTAPKYTYKAGGTTNSIQIDLPGDNWKNAVTYTITGSTLSQGFSTLAFDKLLLGLNLTAGQAATVNVRVVNALSAETKLYSNVLTLSVTPFNLTAFIYVVGQFNGYSTSAPDSLISPTSNGIYSGIINFPAGENQFLILPQKNFNTKYATTLSPNTTPDSISYATEFVTGGGNNLVAPSAGGYYHIILNTITNVISIAQTNSYSAIGSSTPPLGNGYSVDNDLKYVNGDQQWELTTPMPETGAFKIRQNHDWTWSWGVLPTPDGVTLTDNNGGNIPVNAVGTYKITFTYPEAAYSVAGTPPSVTGTYTLVQQ